MAAVLLASLEGIMVALGGADNHCRFLRLGNLVYEFWGRIIGVAVGGFIFAQVMMETVREYVREDLQQSGVQNNGEIA